MTDLVGVGVGLALVIFGWPWGVAVFVGVPVLWIAGGCLIGIADVFRERRCRSP